MAKTWYFLQLKAWIHQKTSWLQIAAVLFLVFFLAGIHIPDAENLKVGLVSGDDEYAEAVIAELLQTDSIFEFILYDDEEELQEELLSGYIDSGFSFSSDFSKMVEERDLEGGIRFFSTPYSAKGLVASETVFHSFLTLYSEEILIDSQEAIFGETREEVSEALIEQYRVNRTEDSLFSLEVLEVEQEKSTGRQIGKKETLYPIQGAIGLLLFVILFLQAGKKLEPGTKGLYLAMTGRRRMRFEYVGYLASVTIPGFLAVLSILFINGSRGILSEVLHMILFLLFGSAWVQIFTSKIKERAVLSTYLFALLIVQVFLCPVLFDFSAYVPALKVLRYLLPLGWLF